jgi:RNA polymerase sigma-70 factor, ECF subfamily
MRSSKTSIRRRNQEEILEVTVDAFREGDRDAFRMLYERFDQPIYRFCRHMMTDEVLARDAFQETFIRMYENRRTLRTYNVQSWLFSIARRVCLNHLRSRRRNHESFDETFHGDSVSLQSDVFLKEHLEKAMEQLPLALKEALILRDVEGHSYNEIAEIVGIDLSLAKVRVYRARLHMRRLLMPVVEERGR